MLYSTTNQRLRKQVFHGFNELITFGAWTNVYSIYLNVLASWLSGEWGFATKGSSLDNINFLHGDISMMYSPSILKVIWSDLQCLVIPCIPASAIESTIGHLILVVRVFLFAKYLIMFDCHPLFCWCDCFCTRWEFGTWVGGHSLVGKEW